jgi:hypothetical protein
VAKENQLAAKNSLVKKYKAANYRILANKSVNPWPKKSMGK